MPGPAANPWFEIDQAGKVTVVTFTIQELMQIDHIEAVAREFINVLEKFSTSQLVLNFSKLMAVSSLLLGKLIMLQNRVRAAGGRLVLCELSPNVRDVFKAVSLLQTFAICGTEREAVQSFR